LPAFSLRGVDFRDFIRELSSGQAKNATSEKKILYTKEVAT
jgi:hypothetical protein